MTRRDVDEFLSRADDVLAEPAAALAACAWCSHPLDDASPSGEFCGERCASDWRAGLDWYPEERCACRTCDPQGYDERTRVWTQRRDHTMSAWLAAARRLRDLPARDVWTTPRSSPARGVFQAWPEIHADTSRAERVLDDVRARVLSWTNAYDEPRGLQDRSNDLPPAPMPPWLRGNETVLAIHDEVVVHDWVDYQSWIPAEVWNAAAEPEPTRRWVGCKPIRRRKRRR